MIRSKHYAALLVVVAVVGVTVSHTGCLVLSGGIHKLQRELYTHLPNALGYTNGAP